MKKLTCFVCHKELNGNSWCFMELNVNELDDWEILNSKNHHWLCKKDFLENLSGKLTKKLVVERL